MLTAFEWSAAQPLYPPSVLDGVIRRAQTVDFRGLAAKYNMPGGRRQRNHHTAFTIWTQLSTVKQCHDGSDSALHGILITALSLAAVELALDFVVLALYDIIVMCDDSASMKVCCRPQAVGKCTCLLRLMHVHLRCNFPSHETGDRIADAYL